MSGGVRIIVAMWITPIFNPSFSAYNPLSPVIILHKLMKQPPLFAFIFFLSHSHSWTFLKIDSVDDKNNPTLLTAKG